MNEEKRLKRTEQLEQTELEDGRVVTIWQLPVLSASLMPWEFCNRATGINIVRDLLLNKLKVLGKSLAI